MTAGATARGLSLFAITGYDDERFRIHRPLKVGCGIDGDHQSFHHRAHLVCTGLRIDLPTTRSCRRRTHRKAPNIAFIDDGAPGRPAKVSYVIYEAEEGGGERRYGPFNVEISKRRRAARMSNRFEARARRRPKAMRTRLERARERREAARVRRSGKRQRKASAQPVVKLTTKRLRPIFRGHRCHRDGVVCQNSADAKQSGVGGVWTWLRERLECGLCSPSCGNFSL